jgi:uncharacterized membrane protein YphA (DoxX/SURF4 family)
MLKRILHTDDAKTTIIIRLMVGSVFFSEGIQKFLFADTLGSGRFAKIGLPNPDFLGPFVGTFEIACGALVLVGLFTRLAALPLFIIISVALITTKVPMVWTDGLWSALHASRTDWAMFLGTIFLIIKGGGRWSADRRMREGMNQ